LTPRAENWEIKVKTGEFMEMECDFRLEIYRLGNGIDGGGAY
jgi:hypothetical protein